LSVKRPLIKINVIAKTTSMLVSSAISEPLRLMCPIEADEARRVLGSGGKMHVAMERCDRAFARKRRVPIGTKADDITGHKRRVRGTASLVLILGAVSTELPKCRGGKEGTRGLFVVCRSRAKACQSPGTTASATHHHSTRHVA
jgi:hypothetical protein